MKPTIILSALMTISLSAASQPTSLHQFLADEVTIDNGEYKVREQWDTDYLMSLSPDRLLYFFRETANLPQVVGNKPYGGWENTDLRGHTLGHYLTSLSLLYAHSHDREAEVRVNSIVRNLRLCQDMINTGYLSAFPESFLDRCERTGEGWAPYYTLHKILQGLIDAYLYVGDETALKVADRFGDYIYTRTLYFADDDRWHLSQRIMEVGGFPEAMLSLYAITGKREHLYAAQRFHQMDKITPAAQGIDQLHGPQLNNDERRRFANYYHCNTTIPQFIAAWRDYSLTGDNSMLRAAQFFWENVADHRTYCNGSTGLHEHWNLQADQLSKELDYTCGETCCTYNMIRLANCLFTSVPDSHYADYVERALINHIMGSIQPETANFMYFHTQKPGSFKTFGINSNNFWCCTGSGMENHQRYAESIYFGTPSQLYVNQYISSTLTWKEQGMKIRQDTQFPCSQQSEFTIEEGSGHFTLNLRIPSWCKDMRVTVNGKKVKGKQTQNGYLAISRKWATGDRISVSLPMHLYTEPLKDNPSIAAVMYGPLVLAADLGDEGLTPDKIAINDNFYNNVPEPFRAIDNIPTITADPSHPDQWLTPTSEPLQFTTTATSNHQPLLFRPLYQINRSRFTDYLTFE